MNTRSRITGTWNDDPLHFQRPKGMARRSFLQVGLMAGLGITLGDLLRMQAHGETKFYESKEGKAKSVIHIYLPGGMAHQESWDPKPFAAPDYRGPFTPIKTSIPGEYVGEKFQNIAKILNKLTVIRSMTHGEAAHERGTHN